MVYCTGAALASLLFLLAAADVAEAAEDAGSAPPAEPPPPPAPPPPPPPPPPSPPVSAAGASTQPKQKHKEKRVANEKFLKEVEMLTQKTLSDLKAAGIQHQLGAWQYGDYSGSRAANAVDCAKACEADSKCFHWNWRIQGARRCDFKKESGDFDEDHKDYVSGHSTRYKGPPPDEYLEF
eukprot:gnl/TRDRNA2_/TRDRNA2_29923_c0_seq2.p1 gnl/TRDRNA2_/TRDRNA2_29923_c0~~gnl/TRDRNA2_/TRDRNA2_29923_c0_seq2.p1  ORF type:complete len:180 (+),score=50.40 gnl/TRDRNA2_/TRDRNA2_29923_c0_seq2:97-636(+)